MKMVNRDHQVRRSQNLLINNLIRPTSRLNFIVTLARFRIGAGLTTPLHTRNARNFGVLLTVRIELARTGATGVQPVSSRCFDRVPLPCLICY